MNPDKIIAAITSLYRVWLTICCCPSRFSLHWFQHSPLQNFLKPTDRFITPYAPTSYRTGTTRFLYSPVDHKGPLPCQSRGTFKCHFGCYFCLEGGLAVSACSLSVCISARWSFWHDPDLKSAVDEVLSYIFAGLGGGTCTGFRDLPFPSICCCGLSSLRNTHSLVHSSKVSYLPRCRNQSATFNNLIFFVQIKSLSELLYTYY
jgi:hypothetical protein